MAAEFDPYQAWLGITKGPQPPNHYELLGLSLFTSEPPVIAEAANEQAAKIMAAAKGPYVPIGKKLLEELKAARALLLNAQNRRDYDARLRAELGLPAPHGSAPAMRAAAAPLGSPAASRPAAV